MLIAMEIRGSWGGQKRCNVPVKMVELAEVLKCFCTLGSFSACIGAGPIETGHAK